MFFSVVQVGDQRSVKLAGDWPETVEIDQAFLVQSDLAHVKIAIEFEVENGSAIYMVDRWDEARGVLIAHREQSMKIEQPPEYLG